MTDAALLPDYPTVEVLERFVETELPRLDAGDLFEVAVRYTNVFARPSPTVRDALVRWLLDHWSDDDLETAEHLVGIVARLGLHECRACMVASAQDGRTVHVREEFQSALVELGPTPWDPYRGYPSPADRGNTSSER